MNIKGNIKYNKNEFYFSVLTLENCYWAGYIAADGCIRHNPDKLQLVCSEKDNILLEKFKNSIKYTGPIRKVIRYKNTAKYKKQEYLESHLSINSKQIIKDLKYNFNITERKSLTLKPPNITDFEQQLAYIIGYIDGDGSICLCKAKSSKDLQINLSILGTYELLNWIYIILNNIENKKYKTLKLCKQNNIFRLRYVAIRAFKILKVLQKINIPFKLQRKWDKINQIEKIKNENVRVNQY